MIPKILAISGSLRSGSTNFSLLNACKTLCSQFADIKILEGLENLPFFNPDLDKEPLEPKVSQLRKQIHQADALLISTPEYAHGIPGLLKNMLDWLVSDPYMLGKPIGLVYASTSEASFAQASLVEILTTMSARVVHDATLNVKASRTKISSSGIVKDVSLERELKKLVRNLVANISKKS